MLKNIKIKKSMITVGAVLMSSIILSGCINPNKEVIPVANESESIETLKGWSFQYNKGTNDYSVFFGLQNENDEYISSDADVDIRIVNDKSEEVYSATKNVSESDFDDYTSKIAGDQYLAEIRIPEDEITPGKSSSGTVYLTVYIDGYALFDEVNCDAFYCLPIADVELESNPLPVTISTKDFGGNNISTYSINDVSFDYDKDHEDYMDITVSGEKIAGSSDDFGDYIGYKVYDSEGYVIDSGELMIMDIAKGDKFREDATIYNVVPGEKYKIVFEADQETGDGSLSPVL